MCRVTPGIFPTASLTRTAVSRASVSRVPRMEPDSSMTRAIPVLSEDILPFLMWTVWTPCLASASLLVSSSPLRRPVMLYR